MSERPDGLPTSSWIERLHWLPPTVIYYGSIAGSVVAIMALWHLLGAPVPAWSTDIQKLDKSQATMAVEVYTAKFRRYNIADPPRDPAARAIWLEDMHKAQMERDAAEQRLIELSK